MAAFEVGGIVLLVLAVLFAIGMIYVTHFSETMLKDEKLTLEERLWEEKINDNLNKSIIELILPFLHLN